MESKNEQDPYLKEYDKEKALAEVELLGNILLQNLQQFYNISCGLEHFTSTGKSAFLCALGTSIASFVKQTIQTGIMTANIPQVKSLGLVNQEEEKTKVPQLKPPTEEELIKIENAWKTL